jgi:hypothetical protein
VDNIDVLLVKYSNGGVIEWAKIFGGSTTEYEADLVQTSDNGYIVLCQTSSYGAGEQDILLTKFNSSGAYLWSRVLGGPDEEYAYSLLKKSSGNILLLGYTKSYGAGASDILLAEYDASGNYQWAKTIGGPEPDGGKSLCTASDGGYVVAGETYSYGAGGCDVIITKFSASNIEQWSTVYGGLSNDYTQAIIQNSSGEYVIIAYTHSFGIGTPNVLITRLNSLGNHVWSRSMGGLGLEVPCELLNTLDGGCAFNGVTESYGAGGQDIHFVKLNSSWGLNWIRVLGGGEAENAYGLIQTPDGGYLIGGYTMSYGQGNNDILLAKYDSSGNTCMGGTISSSLSLAIPVVSSVSPTIISIAPAFGSVNPNVSTPVFTKMTICRYPYSCGDSNADGSVNVSDAVHIINYVFIGGNPPDPMESGDCNCDGSCNVSDAVWIINYVFIGGNDPCDSDGNGEPDC